jgi:transposase
MSLDAKANIKIGPFSRGGYSRHGTVACDHDFNPDSILKLFGIFLPVYDESFFYFTESSLTADFIVDMLDNIWPKIKRRFEPHTLVINLDNGPENNSSRTQFIKRLVEFAHKNEVSIELAYYPPYHSKYNPIERVWGRLENYWNGELLDSVEKVLGLARTMTWKGISPIVNLVKNCYETGVTLTKKTMEQYERMIERLPTLEKWCVSIPFYSD